LLRGSAFHSEKRGCPPLLLIGFAPEPIRALLLATTTYYPFLVVARLLSGINVATDRSRHHRSTAGAGRFNLAAGTIGGPDRDCSVNEHER
jgi:hypothetical protein